MRLALSFFPALCRRPLRTSTLRMSMDMKILQFPFQNDTADYAKLLHMSIPEYKVVRWYISSITNGIATVEAVIEDNGVGTTSNTGS